MRDSKPFQTDGLASIWAIHFTDGGPTEVLGIWPIDPQAGCSIAELSEHTAQ